MPGQHIEDYYSQVVEKGSILKKNDFEIMSKFIQGLPDMLAFYVRACNPENSCNFLNIASKLTNEVPFERRKIYLSTDYNIMIMQQLHN